MMTRHWLQGSPGSLGLAAAVIEGPVCASWILIEQGLGGAGMAARQHTGSARFVMRGEQLMGQGKPLETHALTLPGTCANSRVIRNLRELTGTMRTVPGRRDFLRATVGVAGLSLAGRLPAGAPAPLSVSSLGDGLALISGAGGNVLALSGPEGLLVVDGGAQEHAHELGKALAGLPSGHRVHTAFNTHWHWDHTGSNELFRKGGTNVIAHENTRLWLGTPIWEAWEQRRYPARPKAQPTQSFYKTGRLTFGGQPIEYGYLPQAHTDGDIYVYFPKQNVLAA